MVSKSLKNTSSRKNETRKNETETRKKTIKHRYTKKHYSSGDGMLTTVWGPPMWHFLHTVSFNYPVEPTCNQKKTISRVYTFSTICASLRKMSHKSL